jgi:hypothetical protein
MNWVKLLPKSLGQISQRVSVLLKGRSAERPSLRAALQILVTYLR